MLGFEVEVGEHFFSVEDLFVGGAHHLLVLDMLAAGILGKGAILDFDAGADLVEGCRPQLNIELSHQSWLPHFQAFV